MTGLLRRLARFRLSLLTAAMVCFPKLAQACAVCTAGRDEENAFAFLMTTVFLSLMPLVAIGTLVWVLWRRIQKLESERAEPASLAPRSPAETSH